MIRVPLLPSPSPRASRCPVKNGWSRSGTLPLGRFRLSVVLFGSLGSSFQFPLWLGPRVDSCIVVIDQNDVHSLNRGLQISIS